MFGTEFWEDMKIRRRETCIKVLGSSSNAMHTEKICMLQKVQILQFELDAKKQTNKETKKNTGKCEGQNKKKRYEHVLSIKMKYG